MLAASPLVSVIIPVYNAEKYIEETINSVLNQTFQDFELIVVNDGSTDKSLEIIKNISVKDNRITLINKENTGVCDTRNKGLKSSNGKYISFLDADDLWGSRFLEEAIKVFQSDKAISAIYTKGQIIDGNSKKMNEFIQANTIKNTSDVLEWKQGYVATPSCTIIKKSIIDSIGFWDESLSTAADQDYFLRTSVLTPIHAINKVLFYYRVHDNNMHSNIKMMEKDHLTVFHKADKMGLYPTITFKRRCFSKLYLILAGSWWKNGRNKTRGIYFLFKSFTTHPIHFLKSFI